MEKSQKLNYLLDDRLELIEKVEYWTGDEKEEKRIHKEIDRLTREINRLQTQIHGWEW